MGTTVLPITLTVAIVTALGACAMTSTQSPSTDRIDELIEVIRDPASPELASAAMELSRMGVAADRAVVALAEALRYPRRDSYVAGQALVALGPASLPAIPNLIDALEDERPDVRRLAAAALGSIGPAAMCSVPQLATHMWESDPWVRTAAAGAIDAIAELRIIPPDIALDASNPGVVFADDPEGSLTQTVRDWWLTLGQSIDWEDSSSTCST